MVQEAQKEFEEQANKARQSILDVQHPPLPSAQKWATKSEMAYAQTVKRVDDQLKKVEADAKEKAEKEDADKAPAVE
eukprot:1776095-Karenia_brevis.AAC.1